jgi:hypothetical protein
MENNYLKTYFIYVNDNNEINQVKETQILKHEVSINNNQDETSQYIVPKMDLINKIHFMKNDELGNYVLTNIAFHHIVINNNNVQEYLNHPSSYNFLSEISYFSDIVLKPTNPIFSPLSSLYVIFKNKPKKHNNTKKISFNIKEKKMKKKSLKNFL